MGQGSKCFLGLWSYDCPALNLSGDFEESSKCYSYSTGTGVCQVFAFLSLTVTFVALSLLEVHVWFGYKVLKRKTLIYTSFISAICGWMFMLLSASLYTALAWDECMHQVTQSTDAFKDPGYSYVSTWLIWTMMCFWVPSFIMLEVNKPRGGGARLRQKVKKKKATAVDDFNQL
eukprot:g2560.t1